MDPEDVELDEHYTIETRSKCKRIRMVPNFNVFSFLFFRSFFSLCSCILHPLFLAWYYVYFVCVCIFVIVFVFVILIFVHIQWSIGQNSEDLDTDTEFEPVEDQTMETRSRCNFLHSFIYYLYFCMVFGDFACYIFEFEFQHCRALIPKAWKMASTYFG